MVKQLDLSGKVDSAVGAATDWMQDELRTLADDMDDQDERMTSCEYEVQRLDDRVVYLTARLETLESRARVSPAPEPQPRPKPAPKPRHKAGAIPAAVQRKLDALGTVGW